MLPFFSYADDDEEEEGKVAPTPPSRRTNRERGSKSTEVVTLNSEDEDDDTPLLLLKVIHPWSVCELDSVSLHRIHAHSSPSVEHIRFEIYRSSVCRPCCCWNTSLRAHICRQCCVLQN